MSALRRITVAAARRREPTISARLPVVMTTRRKLPNLFDIDARTSTFVCYGTDAMLAHAEGATSVGIVATLLHPRSKKPTAGKIHLQLQPHDAANVAQLLLEMGRLRGWAFTPGTMVALPVDKKQRH